LQSSATCSIMVIMNAKELSRFLDKTKPSNGCIIWCGYIHPDGYGQFDLKSSKTRRAHRIAWEHVNGAVPEGLELDHLCRNRACVNPVHLEAVTGQENLRRSPIHREAVRRNGRRNGLKSRKSDLPEGVERSGRKFRASA